MALARGGNGSGSQYLSAERPAYRIGQYWSTVCWVERVNVHFALQESCFWLISDKFLRVSLVP